MRRARISLALLALWLAAPRAAAELPALRAGLGSAPLPAPIDGPLAGYGGLRDRRATGTLDPPEARALLLEQGELRVALVSLDVLIARPALRDPLLEAAATRGVDALLLVATHTHSGPGGFLQGWLAERVTAGGFDPEAPDRLVRAAVRALERAAVDLAPAHVASVLARAEFAENRRFEVGPHETALPLLRFDFPSGQRPIVLWAYGAHPTVLSARNRAYSADYVGAARRHLEASGWRSLYLPGPLGDQAPRSAAGPLWPEDPRQERVQLEEIGRGLAQAVTDGVTPLDPVPKVALGALERWVEPPAVRLRRFCALWWLAPFVRSSIGGFLSDRVPLQVIRVGDARLLALPAEPTSAVGQAVRGRVPAGSIPLVVAHANDWLGYVVSPAAYAHGGYEACMSFHGPRLGAWLVDEAAEALRLLETREQRATPVPGSTTQARRTP